MYKCYLLYMEGVASARCNDLIVLLTSMLYDKIDLLLQAKKKQHSLLSRHSFHIHIIYLRQQFDICNHTSRYLSIKM